MKENKQKRYAHLYESQSAEERSPFVAQVVSEEADNLYQRDAKAIRDICTKNNLEDEEANQLLYQKLKGGKVFSTWVGDAFLLALFDRTSKNRNRRTIEKICKKVAVSFLAMAVVLLGALLYQQIKEVKENAVLEYIRREREQLKKSDENDKKTSDKVAILDQYAILYSMYPDVIGWLKVDGTSIDYPVMQDRTGRDYYLKHNFEGKTDNRGALFVEADSTLSPLDQNVVIFGHNMNDRTQFGDLDFYQEQDFFKKHQTFEFDTIYETGLYQIVAVVRTQVRKEDEYGFRYYWFHNYKNRGEFQELLDFIKENSLYDTGEHLRYGDTTIMLSTCEYTVDNGRLVVIAKRI